jgi:hypothetical protein
MNGLKTIFSRITTIDGAEAVLNGANVAMRDLAGNVRPVSDIITDLAANWTELSDEQRQNLGVTLAGRFQLTRFLALMNNFEIAQSATATAIDSSGSAMREQAKYADSLEARLNRLDTAWNKFTLAVGEAVLTDGLIGGIESLNDLATGMATLIDKFGLLSGVFGTFGVLLVAMSTKLRTFSTSIIFGTTNLTAMQVATTGLTATMTRAQVAVRGLGIAFKSAIASTGVGLIFVGLGFAIEMLIGKFSEAKQAQEEFDETQQKGVDALTKNKQEIDSLMKHYDGLSKMKERSAEQEEKFLSVQARLGELYPQLISYIDGSGQAHLKTKQEIEKETKATEMLIQAKKLEAQADAKKNISKSITKRDDIASEIKRIEKELKNPNTIVGYGDGQTVVKKSAEDIKRLQSQLLIYQNQWSTAAQVVTNEVTKVADAYTDLQIDPSISSSVDTFFNSFDSSKLDTGQLEAFAVQIGNAKDELQKAYSSGDATAFEKVSQSVKQIALEMGASEFQATNFALSFDGLKEAAEKGANAVFAGKEGLDGFDDSAMDATGSADGLASGMEGLAGASEDVSKAFEGNISALGIYFGMTSDQVSQIQNAINVYRALGGQASLTAQQQGMLTQATAILGNAFPYLNGKIDENIDWMATQAQVMGALGEISGDEAATLINNQNEKTRVTISNINQRIQGYKEEAAAITKYMDVLIAQMELEGMSGYRLDAYHRAQARLAELQGLIAESQAELGNILYQDAVDLGIIKPDGSDVGGGQSDADREAERAAEEAARNREQFLDDVVDLYKDAYGKQKDIALDALEQEKQAFESAHEAKMQQLDQQLELYENIIEAQMESIDKQVEEEERNKRLRDAQKSRQEILDEMNKLQLDNSFAAKKRMDELRVQLAESDTGITDMQREWEVQDRKDNLQSMLDARRTDIEGQRESEETSYDQGMKFFENRQAEVERYYDNLINDERYFAQVRANILSGSNQQVLQNLHNFHTSMLEGGEVIGESIAQNIIDSIGEVWSKILSGNFTPIRQFHDGGIVGVNSSNNRLTTLANKLFNVKPGEQVIKSLVGELQVPPKNIPNLFTNINGMVSSLLSSRTTSDGGGNPLTIQFNVAKMTGGQKDVEFFLTKIASGVNAMGAKM